MWRLTLAQMRTSVGRLVAVGIAIALGTAFVAATFVTTSTISATALAAARAGVGDPDLIVLTGGATELGQDRLDAIDAIDGVAATQPLGSIWRDVSANGLTSAVAFTPAPADTRLGQVSLLEGTAPSGATEIALPGSVAGRLGIGVGDDVDLIATSWTDDEVARTTQTVVVSGLTADGSGLGFGMPLGQASRALVEEWQDADGWSPWQGVSLLLTPGADASAVESTVRGVLPDSAVVTGDQYAQDQAAQLTGGVSIFRGLILAFAAVALAVAGIVISNTFTVLVAQRTRTLALLRCVGATARQVRRSVRLEALLLGVAASVAGIAAGLVLGQVVLSVLRSVNDGVPLPTIVPVDGWTILVPFVAGVLVTVVAASGAARLATRVAPLAALRPLDAPSADRSRRLGVRAVVGWVVAGLGIAAMVGALAWSRSDPSGAFELALLLGVAGGIVTLVGVVLAAITVVPAFVRLLGRAAGRIGGAPARLAATNSVRNPARTTSTATALIVGVSLVTMMAMGAATARTQLGAALDEHLAVDVTVTSSDGTLTAATIADITQVDGVEHALVLEGTWAEVSAGTGTTTTAVWRVADPSAIADVVRTADSWPRQYAGLADGWVLAQDGQLTIGAAGAIPAGYQPGLPDFTVLLDPEAFAMTGLDVDAAAVWLALAPGADPVAVAQGIEDIVARSVEAGAAAPVVEGGAIERAGYTQIIDTLLVVVIGLLGVAVVIALIGVANTLALSVIERRRENALLRALGLTRRQLRAALATEGVLLALVGAVVGIVLGLAFGWIGSSLLLGVAGDPVPLVVPWGTLGAVVLVAIVAGVLASVLPARSAVRVPPVVALTA